MEFATFLSVLMLLNPGNAVRTEATLDTVPQATARLRATWPETGAPFTMPPLSEESGQTVLKGAVGLFGSCTMIGSPLVYGFAEASTGRSWLGSVSMVKW